MFFSASVILSLLGSLSFTAALNYDVQVSNADAALQYSPESINAQPGDQVTFHFNPKNHTVTQSTLAAPCTHADAGFDSGFMPVATAADSNPTFVIQINDTTPIWVYCKQAANTAASHCGAGMVFAVNPGADGSTNSFTNFKNAALAIGAALKTATSTTSAVASATSTAASATSTGNTHRVAVGLNGTLTFTPPVLEALPNDIVIFEFHPNNHTVTQSSFDDPCVHLNSNGTPGFDSGFMPVSPNATEFPTFSVTINDTAPVWVYCRQTGHCGKGMVFAVNSNETSSHNFAAFQALAEQINGTTTNSTSSNSTGSNSTGTDSGSASSKSSASGSSPASSPTSGAMSAMRIHALAFSTVIVCVVKALL